jgi:hypothetical protein
MRSPVRRDIIDNLRISPAPRKNPAAFENVGAATTVAAANAPSIARRVIEVVLFVAIHSCVPYAQQLERVCECIPSCVILAIKYYTNQAGI